MSQPTARSKSLPQNICITAAVIVIAFLCRRIVLTADITFVEQLANLVRILLYLGLFTIWGASVRKRVIQVQVRTYLVLVAVLMILWLTIRELRWHFVYNGDVKRLLWYAYYIPILLVPLISCFISLSLGKRETYRLPKRTALLYFPALILILLVLTNDLHEWVFIFPQNAEMRTDLDYRYGALFYILAAWGIACTLFAFVTMLKKCRIPRTGEFLWLPLIPLSATVLYIALYVARVPFVTDALGDLTVLECLLFAAFFESCIQCGLIPSNTRYEGLFRASQGLSVQITDKDYAVRYAARDAEHIAQGDLIRAETEAIVLPGGRRLHNMPIRGGHAVWTEDISKLLELRESLADTRDELKDREDLLQTEYEQERQYRRVMEQNRLYDLLQAETQSQLDEVSRLAAAYEQAESEEQKRRILCTIVILGSYIKRRKDFTLTLEDLSEIPVSRLASAFAESFQSLRLAGIRGTYLVETGKSSESGTVLTRFYDFFECVLEAALDELRYITVSVCRVGEELRCIVMTDHAADDAHIRRRFPDMCGGNDEDGSCSYIIFSAGGDRA